MIKRNKIKKNNKNLDGLVYLWDSWYSRIISIIFTFVIAFFLNKYGVEIWKAKYYSDMLTAVITFLSIIISVFGILIPSLISAKDDENSIVKYFLDNSDKNLFAKSVKKTILSGIIAILFVCILFLYDVLNIKLFKAILTISVFLIMYFCCNAYRFVGIMFSLLISSKKISKPKKQHTTQLSKEEIEQINKRLN